MNDASADIGLSPVPLMMGSWVGPITHTHTVA